MQPNLSPYSFGGQRSDMSNESTRVALLEQAMKTVSAQVASLEAKSEAHFNVMENKIDGLADKVTSTFVTKEQHDLDIKELRDKKTFITYAIPVVTAVLASTLTFLIVFYLQHH